MPSGHGFDLDSQIKPLDEVKETARFRPELLTVLALAVHFRAPAVLFGQLEMIECPAMVQELPNLLDLFWQLQCQHFRAIGFDFGALNRVVIDKDETIQPQLELFGQVHEVFRFRTPIQPPGGEMLAPQGHVETVGENFKDVLFVVLAAEAEQPSGVALRAHELLERFARSIQADSFGPVLATHSRPKRLVAIKHDDLICGPIQRVQPARNDRSQAREKGGRVRNMP